MIDELPSVYSDPRVVEATEKVEAMRVKVSALESQIEAHRKATAEYRSSTDADHYLEYGSLPDKGIKDEKLTNLYRELSVAKTAQKLAQDKLKLVVRDVQRELSKAAKELHDPLARELVESFLHCASLMDNYKTVNSALSEKGYSLTQMGEVQFGVMCGLRNPHSTISHKFREFHKQGYITQQELKDIGSRAIYDRDDELRDARKRK